MRDYDAYDVIDFALDDSFRQWVLRNTRDDAAFWDKWVQNNPTRLDVILQAREMVKDIHVAQDDVTDEEIEDAIQQLTVARHQPTLIQTQSQPRFSIGQLAAAVVVLIGVAIAAYFVFNGRQAESSLYALHKQSTSLPLTEVRNNAQSAKLVKLPDGSQVELAAGSRASFPAQFSDQKREVYLSGKAFFSVVRNPQQPFLVYADELTVRVLGTSFTIQAFEKEKEVRVAVKTGKVSVFAQPLATATSKTTDSQPADLILTPNQEGVFNREQHRLTKTLVATPELIAAKDDQKTRFLFERTPVVKVFQALESAYGIPIVYDADVLSGCEISADLTEESLFDKLKLIGKAIDARYQVIDGQIVIESKGCR